MHLQTCREHLMFALAKATQPFMAPGALKGITPAARVPVLIMASRNLGATPGIRPYRCFSTPPSTHTYGLR